MFPGKHIFAEKGSTVFQLHLKTRKALGEFVDHRINLKSSVHPMPSSAAVVPSELPFRGHAYFRGFSTNSLLSVPILAVVCPSSQAYIYCVANFIITTLTCRLRVPPSTSPLSDHFTSIQTLHSTCSMSSHGVSPRRESQRDALRKRCDRIKGDLILAS